MCATVPTGIRTWPGSSPAPGCRWRSPLSSRPGAAFAIPSAEGWVYHSLLSGRRTALVAPWLKTGTVPLREKANGDAAVSARLEHGVLGSLKSCDGQWCRFIGPGFDGFIEQNQLWGVYPNEKID